MLAVVILTRVLFAVTGNLFRNRVKRMDTTPRSNRLHIGVYGRRNAGKSSLINFITGQDVALVSDTPGTTTDPVLKNMELLPLGPVVFIDTAGVDDVGDLGSLRIAKTREMTDRTDLAIMVISIRDNENDSVESAWIEEFKDKKIPVLGVLSQVDRVSLEVAESARVALSERLGIPFTAVSAAFGSGRGALLEAIVRNSPTDFERETILGDIIETGARVVLVAPQDIQAPKGRLILPQVQTIRDILDYGGLAHICTADRLGDMLSSLCGAPDLVVTDSQVFASVDAALPRSVRLTSFSILMARYKGDLETFVAGARKIDELTGNDRVLIAEACTHHAMDGDIGRQKLPAWLREKAGGGLTVDVASGPSFPDNISDYSLIVHCGACMFTRKQLMSRLVRARAAGVPVANYGTAIAALNGILERVVEIFPEISGKVSGIE